MKKFFAAVALILVANAALADIQFKVTPVDSKDTSLQLWIPEMQKNSKCEASFSTSEGIPSLSITVDLADRDGVVFEVGNTDPKINPLPTTDGSKFDFTAEKLLRIDNPPKNLVLFGLLGGDGGTTIAPLLDGSRCELHFKNQKGALTGKIDCKSVSGLDDKSVGAHDILAENLSCPLKAKDSDKN